ncbi:B3/4 domain-containing protein [Desulfocurvibacter africanus]|uniref:B3/B4 domain-containing protein n=1 Tax=Desulfocurvibacter africanus TaxID=873 RepID=UPI0009DC13B5|nr:B3/4 domain-containing protein [Desulfocurvibacter africanus]
MVSVLPSIDPAIYKIAPEFKCLNVTVEGSEIGNPDIAREVLENACRSVLEDDVPWAEKHMEEWAEAFKRFGAKPNRTSCSAAALRKRVLKDGCLPSIDPIVNLYNAVSIRYAIPVGGENIAAYVGMPRLTIADGTESFDIMKNGEAAYESPAKGEVIWRDDVGVTCRRWNWRQCVRTRICSETRNIWFILESLPAMPLESLYEAGKTLTDNLKLIMPAAVIEQKLIIVDKS